jgi:radical SAM superfamily enzyme YgiQ (UPF0313 family)
MRHCKQRRIVVPGDFQIGLPGETPATIERTIQYAMKLDPETTQVSISHPYPGTEFYAYVTQHGYLTAQSWISPGTHAPFPYIWHMREIVQEPAREPHKDLTLTQI